jgi:hypothetical protein
MLAQFVRQRLTFKEDILAAITSILIGMDEYRNPHLEAALQGVWSSPALDNRFSVLRYMTRWMPKLVLGRLNARK